MEEIEKRVDDMNTPVGDDALNIEVPAELPSEEVVLIPDKELEKTSF